MLWKYFQDCMNTFREKWGINLKIWHTVPRFSTKLLVIGEIESTFPVSFWDYLAECWWLRDMVSICLKRKGKYEWFLHEELLFDLLVFLLYLMQSGCCCKYSAKTTNVSILTLFLHFLYPCIMKNFSISVTVMWSNFSINLSTRGA